MLRRIDHATADELFHYFAFHLILARRRSPIGIHLVPENGYALAISTDSRDNFHLSPFRRREKYRRKIRRKSSIQKRHTRPKSILAMTQNLLCTSLGKLTSDGDVPFSRAVRPALSPGHKRAGIRRERINVRGVKHRGISGVSADVTDDLRMYTREGGNRVGRKLDYRACGSTCSPTKSRNACSRRTERIIDSRSFVGSVGSFVRSFDLA